MAATKESTATEPDTKELENAERFEEIERHISHLLNTREHAQNCSIDHGPEILFATKDFKQPING